MNRLLYWFLCTRIGQWVSCLVSGGWCHLAKNDPRYAIAPDTDCLTYQGEPSYAPSKVGPSTQRKKWHTWIIFRVAKSRTPRFVVIDTAFGHRVACVGKEIREGVVAIRVGHESGIIRLGARNLVPQLVVKPEFLARWKESELWPLTAVPKNQVMFI